METKRNLMDLYRRLSRMGEYKVARNILHLLMQGSILLMDLSDTDQQTKYLLEDMGISVWTLSNGWIQAKIA